MSPEIADAQAEIWAAEYDLKRDAEMIGEKARMDLTPVEVLRRHPLTVIAIVSFAAYLVYRAAAGGRNGEHDSAE